MKQTVVNTSSGVPMTFQDKTIKLLETRTVIFRSVLCQLKQWKYIPNLFVYIPGQVATCNLGIGFTVLLRTARSTDCRRVWRLQVGRRPHPGVHELLGRRSHLHFWRKLWGSFLCDEGVLNSFLIDIKHISFFKINWSFSPLNQVTQSLILPTIVIVLFYKTI